MDTTPQFFHKPDDTIVNPIPPLPEGPIWTKAMVAKMNREGLPADAPFSVWVSTQMSCYVNMNGKYSVPRVNNVESVPVMDVLREDAMALLAQLLNSLPDAEREEAQALISRHSEYKERSKEYLSKFQEENPDWA